MHACKPILLSMGTIFLLSAMCTPAVASRVSGLTDLSILVDADRLHFSNKDISFAQALLADSLANAWRQDNQDKVASDLTDQGVLNMLKGDLAQAKTLCEQGLLIRKKQHGNEDVRVAESFNALSAIALQSSDHASAKQFADAAILIEKQNSDQNELRLADSYDLISRTYLDEGNFEKAEPLAFDSFHIRANILGSTHPAVAQSYYTLALYHAQNGDLENARAMLEQSIANADPLQKPKSLIAQSMLFAAQGKIEESRKLFDEGIKIRESIIGKNAGADGLKVQYIKFLWNHQHWADAIELRSELPFRVVQSQESDARLIHRSFCRTDVAQQIESKNLAIIVSLVIAALSVMGILVCLPRFLYMPEGSGFLEFLKSTRRQDLQTRPTKSLTPANGKLRLLPQRETKPHWTPEE